ncbi:hypothetical protein SAMN05660653_01544 [Desulfonatronum thiosulfatophilum]|uniref:Uncharacterized protein n=1 Tax=Desulfonatronum thiosulfatophilum TaxID=617002 RepID=A0A1G6CIF4_9BACT|nr:hypothetical protein [Desulfonatronum thiosulfatophilum]SDB32552.1 hypothetical protein SAMN05660653_01544 [Desulfonatronum thiosulfatophilum]
MSITWEQAFSQVKDMIWQDPWALKEMPELSSLPELRRFLDMVHIKYCLIKPYFETANYPLVEARELLPSFDLDIFEYRHLPGFSLVALARPLSYFQEIFQFDILHSPFEYLDQEDSSICPLETHILHQNQLAFQNRLPRQMHDEFQYYFSERDLTALEHYPRVLSFLLHMERGHVFSTIPSGPFVFSGVNASFPSDLDTELKRFGLRIGMFKVGSNRCYELNRNFVYQFLMELYGFSIVSERRTSSALFARRLYKLSEEFLVRVLGQSDRTITTLYKNSHANPYPQVEKIALVRIDSDQLDLIDHLSRLGAFVDSQNNVVVLRVTYRQHRYDKNNVRQDRALSVLRQEIIHPLTGEVCCEANVIKDISNMLLKLNDIVKGEYIGSIRFKKSEVVSNTDTHEKRLKFLYAWLSKHQRRIIGYGDEFYSGVVKVLDGYIFQPEHLDTFKSHPRLYNDVWSKYSYIRQARKVRILEDLTRRSRKGTPLSWLDMLQQMNELLNDFKFEIHPYFDGLMERVIDQCEKVLRNSYLNKRYVQLDDDRPGRYGLKVKTQYRRLVGLVDELKDIRKQRPEFRQANSVQSEKDK